MGSERDQLLAVGKREQEHAVTITFVYLLGWAVAIGATIIVIASWF